MERKALSGIPVGELLRRARAGEADALEELFDQCRTRFGEWASRSRSRMRPGVARPSDMVQDSALRAFRAFSSFKGTTEKEWTAWLQSIFQSQEVQQIRYSKRQKRDELNTIPLDDPDSLTAPTPQRTPSQTSSFREEWRLLLTCLYELPDDQREAISLCSLKELPVAEAARSLGRSELAVAGLLKRGLKTLRNSMASIEARMSVHNATASKSSTRALLDYLRRRDAGERVEPSAFVAEYPDCADELRDMLDWIERLQALRPASPAS